MRQRLRHAKLHVPSNCLHDNTALIGPDKACITGLRDKKNEGKASCCGDGLGVRNRCSSSDCE
eukprot:4774605-Amphidinium_carterae.1